MLLISSVNSLLLGWGQSAREIILPIFDDSSFVLLRIEDIKGHYCDNDDMLSNGFWSGFLAGAFLVFLVFFVANRVARSRAVRK